jgi:hypothetical protein
MVIVERGIKLKAKSMEEFLSRSIYLPDDIKNLYQNGDEIWYYSDFGFAPERCEREAILLVRNGKFIRNHIIKMS